MNASRPPFSFVVPSLRSGALVGACAILSACSNVPFTHTAVDPASPVAADMARVKAQAGSFPTFASIPPKPKDLRPVANYGQDAKQIEMAGAALIAATEPSTWTLQGTTQFADKARRDAGPAIEPANPGEAEAFARELRERATPPPPR